MTSRVLKKLYKRALKFNKTLPKKTREAAASAAFQHVWIRNGQMFVRKNDTSYFLTHHGQQGFK